MLAPSRTSVRGVLEKMAGLASGTLAAMAGVHKITIPARERSNFRWVITKFLRLKWTESNGTRGVAELFYGQKSLCCYFRAGGATKLRSKDNKRVI